MSEPVSQPTPPQQIAAAAGVADQLAIENSIEIYKITADWIRFADTKAAVVLTVAGTFCGLLIPQLKPLLAQIFAKNVHPTVAALALACFTAWFGLLLLSAVWALRCIVPYRRKGRHPALDLCKHFHGAAIARAFSMDDGLEFYRSYRKLGHEDILAEVLSGILIDAHISNSKYAHVTWSIRIFFVSAVFGFLFLLFSQFAPA